MLLCALASAYSALLFVSLSHVFAPSSVYNMNISAETPENEMVSDTDARLAKAARAGDKQAFSRLVERHYRAIYGLAYASVGNWSAAEELTQEAFLVAYANLQRLRVPGVFLM